MTHMPIKFAWRVDVGSACVDIRQSPKTDVLVKLILCYVPVDNKCVKLSTLTTTIW